MWLPRLNRGGRRPAKQSISHGTYKQGLTSVKAIAVIISAGKWAQLNGHISGGYDAMSSLLSSSEPPDAVFVANNLMTVGALRCLADRGVDVPREMGVVGFDELPWADLIRPSLTTVAQPTYELGRMAARLLVDRIASPAAEPATVVLPAELRPRQSSAP
ncbi:substrate-binding domain-containing protein [Nonomuraea polychroma]|uniref:substrate-binding domain-containing protein n=1 Tax=Nonomuraea polychroma TaxID=46176 RepID=UPI003D948BD9